MVDNVTGFSCHKISSGGRVASYSAPNATGQARQVVFGEDNNIVVAGGSNGNVLVFNARDGGEPIEVFPHTNHGQVQTVAVRS